MKTIQDEMLEEEEEDDNIPLAAVAEKGTHESADLRPVRTAKSKANQNLVRKFSVFLLEFSNSSRRLLLSRIRIIQRRTQFPNSSF